MKLWERRLKFTLPQFLATFVVIRFTDGTTWQIIASIACLVFIGCNNYVEGFRVGREY